MGLTIRETIYLEARAPCWLCSAPLMRATVGENAGRYSAVRVEFDGHERICHEDCAREEIEALSMGGRGVHGLGMPETEEAVSMAERELEQYDPKASILSLGEVIR